MNTTSHLLSRNGDRHVDFPTPSENGASPLAPEMTGQIFEQVTLSGLKILLPLPVSVSARTLFGQEKLLENLSTAWAAGLHPSIEGEPGYGKTEAGHQAARLHHMDVYTFNGHGEVTPEDLILTARVADAGRIEYVGSAVLAAVIRGGGALVDEIGKIPSRSLSPLASLLDDRRTLCSSLAGINIKAHPDFRFVATLNTADRELDPLPGFIDERLRPRFTAGYPEAKHYPSIVQAAVPQAPPELLDAFRDWMHGRSRSISPRSAITIFRFAASKMVLAGGSRTKKDALQILTDLATHVLDASAPGRAASQGTNAKPEDEASPW